MTALEDAPLLHPTLMNQQDSTSLALAVAHHRDWSRSIPITTVGAPK